MKILVVLFTLFFSVDALAQVKTVEQAGSASYTTIEKLVKDSAQFVLNGSLSSYQALKEIDPKDILPIDILTYEAGTSDRAESGGKKSVIIVSKNYAQKPYKEKLSTFSDAYKNHLSENKTDDKVLYVVNGVSFQSQNPEDIKSLYNIKKEDIKTVTFNWSGQDHTFSTMVIIITK